MERDPSPFDLTEKEAKFLQEHKLHARWVLEGEDGRAAAHVEGVKRKGYERHPELQRQVGQQRLYVCSRENKERRDEMKRGMNEERMALMREHCAVIMDRTASGLKGVRPVGYMGSNKDINFDKRMQFKGDKAPVARREED